MSRRFGALGLSPAMSASSILSGLAYWCRFSLKPSDSSAVVIPVLGFDTSGTVALRLNNVLENRRALRAIAPLDARLP